MPTEEQQQNLAISAVQSAFTPANQQQGDAVQAVADAFGGKQEAQTPQSPVVLPDEPIVPSIKADEIKTAQEPQIPQDTAQDFLRQNIASLINEDIKTPERAQQEDLIDQFIKTSGVLGGEASDKLGLQEQFKVNQFEQEMIDINATAQNLQQDLRQGELDRRKEGGLGLFMRSDINESRQQAAIELQGLQAAFNIAEGNYLLAEKKVQSALDAKYEPVRLKLETIKSVLEFNKDLMTSAEQKAARQQENKINFMLSELNNQREEEESATQLLTQIAQRGTANPQDIARAFQQVARGQLTTADVAGQFAEAIGTPTEEEQLALNEQNLRNQLLNEQILSEQASRKPSGGGSLADLIYANTLQGPIQYGTPQYFEGVIAGSQGGKDLVAGQTEQIAQFQRAMSGITSLTNQLELTDVKNSESREIWGDKKGKIEGRLSTLKQQFIEDADVAAINATIQGLIPTVARGVFGEVGVLTDNDINNYKKTLPSLINSGQEAQAITMIMLDVLQRGYGGYLETLAASGKDVSGFLPQYQNLTRQVTGLQLELNGVSSDEAAIYNGTR
jgi:O6-methylguanine-DNA--protein-cysteine methyltransferase